MYRKFSELTQSEQFHFNSLVAFMRETWNERIEVKLDIVKRFNLDIGDPVVMDFLTGVYAPPALTPMPVKDDIPPPKLRPHHENPDRIDPPIPIADFFKKQTMAVQEPSLPVVASVQQVEKPKKREMTYANSEDLIVIQNRLLHAISHLTLNERRLILFLSPIVRKQIEEDPNNRVFYVYVQDFVNEYGIKSKKYYGELEKIADSIIEKAFFFWYKTANGKAKKGVSWVSECDYIENEAKIKIKLDDTVIEMLTVFDKATGNFWTQYQKEWIINLGAYGIIMLEMVLSSKENNGYYTVEHLREKFNCINLYPRFSNFKLYVIDKAIKEIDKYTPIKISYEINKIGKNVKGLQFSYIDTSIKTLKDKTKNSNNEINEVNPFVNFKMTQKQLSLFASKIKKASGQDVEVIIAELSNVHLQSKHIDFLKILDYIPSDWYSDDEIKNHLTAEQIAQAKADKKAQAKAQERQRREQFKADMNKLIAHAEIFVKANLNRIGKTGIAQVYLQQGNYVGIVQLWEHHLLDERVRKHFAMLDEILAQ